MIPEVDLEYISEEWRTARTAKPCLCCAAGIKPGERYVRVVYKEDGQLRCDVSHDRHGYCYFTEQEKREQ